MHPELPVSRNYKTKESEVVNRIKDAFPDFTWIADKCVQGGCSRRRPDLLVDLESHIIIVEVDENQHSEYNCSCETERINQLSEDVKYKPIVFIRFNPDAYTSLDGMPVKSCWITNKLGVVQISKSKLTEWEDRICTLKNAIQYWIENATDKLVEIIELFYG